LNPARQRARLGLLCAAFGLLELAAWAFAWLSSHGPSPAAVSGRAWSVFYYAHFAGLVVAGYALLFAEAARARVFHGGPTMDFTLGIAGLVIASSFGRGWLPAAYLVAFGLRLAGGRPLLGDR
jgi:hypothetical protein